MQTDIHLSNDDDLEIDVSLFDASVRPWFVIRFGPIGNSTKLFLSQKQMIEIMGRASNELISTCAPSLKSAQMASVVLSFNPKYETAFANA